jgi:hypothetical protein
LSDIRVDISDDVDDDDLEFEPALYDSDDDSDDDNDDDDDDDDDDQMEDVHKVVDEDNGAEQMRVGRILAGLVMAFLMITTFRTKKLQLSVRGVSCGEMRSTKLRCIHLVAVIFQNNLHKICFRGLQPNHVEFHRSKCSIFEICLWQSPRTKRSALEHS